MFLPEKYGLGILLSLSESYRKMSIPLVSIIVPVYKVEKYLRTCINSVLHQSYTSWELILVDDGSPDDSGEICDEYANRDARIKVIHKSNAGVAAARNSAVGMAVGEYISFLDGDDYLHPDYIRNMVHLMCLYDADIVQCGYVRGKETAFPAFCGKETVKCYTMHDVFTQGIAKIIVWGKLYRKGILKEIRIPEGHFFEDDLVTWRWYYAADKTVVTSRPYYYYACNEQSQMSQHQKKPNLSFIEAYDERIAFFRSTGERDLEDCSHLHICKSLLLVYSNPMLTQEQRKDVRNRFKMSWKEIKSSQLVSFPFKFIFGTFDKYPTLTSTLIKYLRRNV